jgi:hypothetical protein
MILHYTCLTALSYYAIKQIARRHRPSIISYLAGGPDSSASPSKNSLRASNYGLYGPLKALSEQEAEKWFRARR